MEKILRVFWHKTRTAKISAEKKFEKRPFFRPHHKSLKNILLKINQQINYDNKKIFFFQKQKSGKKCPKIAHFSAKKSVALKIDFLRNFRRIEKIKFFKKIVHFIFITPF